MFAMEKSIERKPLGVIDALSAGFELVLRQPWVLLIPIALDLFLWLGPQIRAKPVFDQMVSLMTAVVLQGAPTEAQQAVEAMQTALQAAGDQFNLFSVVALFGMGLPTLMGSGLPASDAIKPVVLFAVQDTGTLGGWILLLALLGILAGSIYLEGIARIVRHELGLATLLPHLLKRYANIVALVLVALLGAIVLSLPFLFSALLVSLINQGLGSFFVLAGWLVLLWAGLYLAFAVPAIFVSGANVAQAILNSVAVFRYNFWSAMGLLFLIVLLQTGFSVIWQELLGTVLGTVFGTLANAILGTATVAAGMLFYYDRFTWLSQVRQRIRQQQRPTIKG